ncbi:MAG: M28 family metallopeptidase [Terriglobales bacterium]|jgi:Zn-dependent M28 family amino/carboxypeptidase
MKKTVVLILLSLSVAVLARSAANSGQFEFDGKTWWNYVKVLADDNMEGRQTGSEGLKRAEAYIVEQIKADGLQPAGSNSYYQPIKFIESTLDEAHSNLELIRNGQAELLVLGDDAVLGTRNDGGEVNAPLVFIGYGLRIPEKNYDDLANLDLKGKVVVIFNGSPSELPTELASHYQSTGERWKALKAAGAVGVIGIPNPAAMDIPWERIKTSRLQPAMRLADLNETEGEKLAVYFNPASAQKLFEGSGHSFAEIAALGKDRKPLPQFPLAVSVRATTKLDHRDLQSSNVVAKLPGSEPKLKNEYVVVSAHIDHLGIGEPVNGDRIYNGAMDNGSGSALLLDLARSFKEHPENLRRSVLFLWVTAEEKGLLGSRYFALHPTAPGNSLVADLNTDMFLPIVPLKLLTVYGLNESDLGDVAWEAAEHWGVKVQSDPEPLRNIFIRSDQYSFIRVGVPSIAMKVGFEPGTQEAAINKKWLTEHYHAPSDDLNQPVDLEAAAKFEDICRTIVIEVGNSPQRPEWKAGSFFKRFANNSSAAKSDQ